jgi:hypothetical protein
LVVDSVDSQITVGWQALTDVFVESCGAMASRKMAAVLSGSELDQLALFEVDHVRGQLAEVPISDRWELREDHTDPTDNARGQPLALLHECRQGIKALAKEVFLVDLPFEDGFAKPGDVQVNISEHQKHGLRLGDRRERQDRFAVPERSPDRGKSFHRRPGERGQRKYVHAGVVMELPEM